MLETKLAILKKFGEGMWVKDITSLFDMVETTVITIKKDKGCVQLNSRLGCAISSSPGSPNERLISWVHWHRFILMTWGGWRLLRLTNTYLRRRAREAGKEVSQCSCLYVNFIKVGILNIIPNYITKELSYKCKKISQYKNKGTHIFSAIFKV